MIESRIYLGYGNWFNTQITKAISLSKKVVLFTVLKSINSNPSNQGQNFPATCFYGKCSKNINFRIDGREEQVRNTSKQAPG